MNFSNEQLAELRNKLGLMNKRVVGFVGGLTHWHNFDFLLDLIKNLRETYSDVVLLIVGDGPLRKKIESGSVERGLESAIKITGTLPHLEVRKYLELVDVAVIPHSNEYRSPIKLFEYMGASKPVVAPATQPIQTVIREGVDGLTFRPGDRYGALKQLLCLFSVPDFRKNMGLQAKNNIMKNYLYESHSSYILSAFQKQNKSF
jgi:glycosyltransferase involved in cell wall biosynthesis